MKKSKLGEEKHRMYSLRRKRVSENLMLESRLVLKEVGCKREYRERYPPCRTPLS